MVRAETSYDYYFRTPIEAVRHTIFRNMGKEIMLKEKLKKNSEELKTLFSLEKKLS